MKHLLTSTQSRRAVLKGAAASTALAFEGAFGAAIAQGADTIKIGALNVYTKGYGVFGEAAYKGMMLYLDENNGMVAGRKVEILREDDEFNPQVGLQKLRKLVESDKVQVIMLAIAMAPFLTIGRCSPLPTAKMQLCGGLMMAENSRMPNIPKLEIEKPPPWNSSDFSFLSLARAAKSFISFEMMARPFLSAFRMIGVIRPSGVATAIEISTLS